MGKRYYWLKLREDFFRRREARKLRTLENGDTLLIIYMEIMLLTLQTDGIYHYMGLEDSVAKELALELGEDADTVDYLLGTLLNWGVITTEDGYDYYIPAVEENTGSEGSSAERMRNKRARDKEETEEKPRPAQPGPPSLKPFFSAPKSSERTM